MVELDMLRDEAAWAESLSEILDEWADLLGFPEQKGDPGKITARVSAVLDGTWRRLMPEGMEWPMFEDGEPVRIGEHWGEDDFDTSVTRVDTIEFAADGVRLGNEYTEAFYRPGERVKRPAPKVLDADGVEIRIGDVVRQTYDFYGGSYTVTGFNDGIVTIKANAGNESDDTFEMPDQLTHRAPVLAADGKPLEVGQTVYGVGDDEEFEVANIRDGMPLLKCRGGEAKYTATEPEYLTHERPVLDADGVPIKVGDTVYLLPGEWCGGYPLRYYSAGDEMVIKELCPDHEYEGVLKCAGDGKCTCFPLPCQLAHTKPEPDSWSSVWADVSNGNESPEGMMRRCKALAERERGE